jgi:hypothetical protein
MSGQSDELRSDIDMRYRYGIPMWEIGHQVDSDMNIDMGYGISI